LKGTSSVALASEKAENLVIQAAREYFVRKEVPHRWELTLGLTFNVIKEVQCFLRKSSQKSLPFYSFYFTCLREELRENISFSSKREG